MFAQNGAARVQCSKRSKSTIQESGKCVKPTIICGDVGIDPFRAPNRLPAKFEASIDTNQFKHQPLRTPISIAKRMYDVELTVVVRQPGDEVRTRQTNEIVFLLKLQKELVRLSLDPGDVREPCAAFADVDRPKVACPIINILKKMEVNCAQGRQGNIIEIRLVLLDAGLGQLDFSDFQGILIGDAELIDQNARFRITILNVLAYPVLS